MVLIDVLPFEFAFRVGSVKVEFGSFEGISIPILAAILRLFWRASVLRCVLAAAITVLLFASAFRYGFNIPLPGSG